VQTSALEMINSIKLREADSPPAMLSIISPDLAVVGLLSQDNGSKSVWHLIDGSESEARDYAVIIFKLFKRLPHVESMWYGCTGSVDSDSLREILNRYHFIRVLQETYV